MIVDWARDIYRKEIMKCLASSIAGSREFTPADSLISYSPHSEGETPENQSDVESSPGDSLPTISHVENNIIGTSNDPTSPIHLAENDDEDIIDLGDLHPSSELVSTPNATSDSGIGSFDALTVSDVEMVDSGHEDVSEIASPVPEVQDTVIRHANDVIFAFQTLALPESQSDLMRLLTSSSTTSDIAQAAGNLVMLFCGRNQIITKRSTVRYLQSWWTDAESARQPHNSDVDDDIVIAHLSFESYFRQQDWKLVRKLTCIMASSNTIEALARISSIGRPITNNYRGEHICTRNNFLTATLFLRNICGEKSAKSGISNLRLYLCQDYASLLRGRPQYEWRKVIPQIGDVLGALYHTDRLIKVSNLEKPKQVRFSMMQNMPFALEFGPQIQTIGAFLAKKPDSWPDTCPKYSLVVFDQSNIEDGHLMASKISDAVWNQAFFHESRSGIPQADATAFELWAQRLRGESTTNSN